MGKLYIVPTPVGNLEDMTLRSLRILKEVDLLLAEDTRTTGVLLKHFEISVPMHSYHKFNEHRVVEDIVEKIEGGGNVALVSDAGTPGISDPGFLLVRQCAERHIAVECLPGATAFVPALINSGLPCDRFCFEGFLPQKKGRNKRLDQLSAEHRTMVFYESPYRVQRTLDEFIALFGAERQASVSREISKKFEETRRGTLGELKTHFTEHPPKGEFVLVVAGKEEHEC